MKNFIEQIARKYSWQYGGMLAWLIQRVTGVLPLFYLFLHIRTVHRLSQGPEAFNEAMAFFQRPAFKLLEVAATCDTSGHDLTVAVVNLDRERAHAALRLAHPAPGTRGWTNRRLWTWSATMTCGP